MNDDITSIADDYITLRRYGEVFSDIQRLRIATENRLRSLGATEAEESAVVGELRGAEESAAKAVLSEYRQVANTGIRAWQKSSIGIGEHMLARLLGVIGHPRIATPHHWEGQGQSDSNEAPPTSDADTLTYQDSFTRIEVSSASALSKPNGVRQPVRTLVADPAHLRNVAKLWAYCGHGDPARRRTKGMTQEEALALGSPRAKMIVHLMAELCIRQRHGDYRKVYDAARAVYATRPDDEWSDLRRHNAALRKTGKEILKDLWVAAGEVE
jgi:hypothetical protein